MFPRLSRRSVRRVRRIAATTLLGAALVGTAPVGEALAGTVAIQGGTLSATSPRKGGNPEAARLTSPIADSPEARAAGRRTYQRLCSRCHGVEGKGDGGGAGAGGQPADFTDATWTFGGSPGEIYTVIRDGTSADMESYSERLAADEIWRLVHYLRGLAAPQGAQP
jgi:mono/diheme cytochrome c family protein